MILFEIPIPFVANKITQKIYELNQEQFEQNQVNLSIKSIALGWNYNINRPVVLFKGISYNQSNYSINLSKVGFYPSIGNIIKEKKLYLNKIFFEGLNFIVTDEQSGYKIRLGNKNLLINDKEQQKENKISETKSQDSFLDKLQSRENFKNGKYYQLIEDLKKESDILKYLDEFIIYKSNIIFINQQKRLLILDVDDLSLKENSKQILINLSSALTFDNDTDRISQLDFSGSINSNNIVKWDISLGKILLANVHQYILKDKILSDLSLEGFEGSINLDGFYDTTQGLQDFNTIVDVKQGSLSYKDYVSTPMRINNISYKLFYDKKNDTLNVDDFNINFANNNMFSSNKLGLNILLNKLNAGLKYNFNDNSFVAKDITIFSGTNKLILGVDYLPYTKEKQGFFKLNVKSSNLDVKFVKLAWPKNYLSDIRKWIVNNVSKGNVDNTSFKMELSLNKDTSKIASLEGDVFLSDAQLTYLKGLPTAQAKKVVVNYNLDDVSIKYSDAITGNIASKKGEVRFFSNTTGKNQPEEEIMSLDLEAASSIEDALLFINRKPLDLLEPTGLIPNKFGGNVTGKVKLKYSLDKSEVFDKDINLHFTQASLEEALPDLNVSNGDLKFLLNDSGLRINGILNALEEQVSTGIQINWENEDNIIQTYSVGIKNFPVDKLNRITFLDKKVIAMMAGSIDGDFTYYKDSKNEKLTFYNDLSNALFYIDVFNYKSKVGSKLIIEGTSIFDNSNLKEIRDLKLNSSDLSITMNLDFDENKELKKILFSNFYIKNKASFKGNIDFSNNIKSFDLQGSLLDIAPIFGYFRGTNDMYSEDEVEVNKESLRKKRGIILRKEPKVEKEVQKEIINDTNLPEDESLDNVNTDDTLLSEKVGNIRLKLSFDKVFNGDEFMDNVYLNLLWEDNFLRLLNFSSIIDSTTENSYAIFNDKDSILGFRIQNLGSFLRLLEFPSNIRNGDLEGKVNIKKITSTQDKKKFYIESNGQFTLNNFSVGLSFASSYGSFRGRDLYFRIDKLELQGNLMGGDMKGYIDVKNRNLDIYGKLIPIWSVNNIISNLPILKTLFDNVPVASAAKNLIQINSRIRGPFDDIKYSIFTRDVKKGDVINELSSDNLEKGDPREEIDIQSQDNQTENAKDTDNSEKKPN